MVWSRRSSTWHPGNWRRTREYVMHRDRGLCRWPVADAECGEPAAEVDRRIPYSQGGTSDPDNAWSLCRAHHALKTGREATTARETRARREPPTHPSRRR